MSGERLTWAIDCDDVVVPSADTIIRHYNAAYGTNLSIDAMYDNNNTWGAASHSEAARRVGELLRGGALDDAVPDSETIEALTRLARLDELHMVIGRQSYLEDVTYRMLDRYLPRVFQSVEHTNYYAGEEGSGLIARTKGEVCAAIGADVLLDDLVVHGESVLVYGVKEVLVWGDYPWNRTQRLGAGMVRCTSWGEVFRERERILASR